MVEKTSVIPRDLVEDLVIEIKQSEKFLGRRFLLYHNLIYTYKTL